MAMVERVTATRVAFNPLDPIGTILDGALNRIEKSLDETMNKAHDAALDIIVKASGEVIGIISSLKAAYTDSLLLTYQKADQFIRDNIDRIDGMVTDVIEKNEEALLKIADRVEEVIKMSPLSNWWLPILSEVTPHFFAVDATHDDKPSLTKVIIKFKGNFAYADRSECTPFLMLNNQKVTANGNNTKELVCLIDVSSNDPQLKMNSYSFLPATLNVPWYSGFTRFSWTVSEYKVLLGMIPASPGQISIVCTKAESIKTQALGSPVVDVPRTKKHWTTETIILHPTPGWHVVRGSSTLLWLEKHGAQTGQEFVSDDHDQIIWRYSRKDGSGKVQVVANESHGVPAQQRVLEKNDLRWGNSWMPEIEPSETITQIMLKAFNGDVFQLPPETDHSNPFIEVRKLEKGVQIKVKKASELKFDSLSLTREMFV